ncbi:MAG: hypothetical protein CK430_09080 [Legionella sp.]|nr:MAG: hypothetical protein CK430_09080 [Legionella sp.]
MVSSLTSFDSYFRGGRTDTLKNHMKYYDKNLEELEKDFHKTTISASPEIKAQIKSIVKNLNISPQEWKEEFKKENLTIYEFLLKLAKKGYSQSDYIISLIDKKTQFGKLTLFLGGSGIIVTLITTLMATSTLQLTWELIKAFSSWIYGAPILGLIGTFSMGLFDFYSNYHNQKATIANRFRDNFFLILTTVAKLTASILLLAAGVVMSPVIAGIFVLGSGIDVLKELFCLAQEYFQYKFFSPHLNENDQLSVHRAYARRVFGYESRMSSLQINLLAALAIVAIMALWCFFPGGGLAISIGAIAAIGLVYTAKYLWLKHKESTLREHLQEQLHDLEAVYNNEEPVMVLNDVSLDSGPEPKLESPAITVSQHATSSTYSQREKKEPSARELPFFSTGENFSRLPEELCSQSDLSSLSTSEKDPKLNHLGYICLS